MTGTALSSGPAFASSANVGSASVAGGLAVPPRWVRTRRATSISTPTMAAARISRTNGRSSVGFRFGLG
ncbi:MAG: hypothetical protein HYX50_02090 [Chloroflexi bacterium]|nr:hypothetical protein [Chloroflexota bacterium]